MKKSRPTKYRKHIYWLTAKEETALREELASRDVRMRSAKGVVCTPLDAINKISSVSPEVWNDTCARQGSWYRASSMNGLYLVVSSFDLKGYESKKSAIITESNFNPPRFATKEEKKALCQDPVFKNTIPPDWKEVREIEKKIYVRWAKRLGSERDDYEFLFLTQTANHANFVKPLLFIEKDSEIVPYSIDKSAHLCSSCVELFQVIGSNFKQKLVSPCPGATIFARLKPDRYLLVEKP